MIICCDNYLFATIALCLLASELSINIATISKNRKSRFGAHHTPASPGSYCELWARYRPLGRAGCFRPGAGMSGRAPSSPPPAQPLPQLACHYDCYGQRIDQTGRQQAERPAIFVFLSNKLKSNTCVRLIFCDAESIKHIFFDNRG